MKFSPWKAKLVEITLENDIHPKFPKKKIYHQKSEISLFKKNKINGKVCTYPIVTVIRSLIFELAKYRQKMEKTEKINLKNEVYFERFLSPEMTPSHKEQIARISTIVF